MKIIFFANTDWYLYNFRLPLAKTIISLGHELLLLSPGGPYVEKIRKEGLRWQEISLSRQGMNPLLEISTIKKLATVYRYEQPEVVHHFTSKCVLYGSIAAKMVGVDRIVNAVTGMGYIFTGDSFIKTLIKPLVVMLYRIALKDTRVIFQNQQDLDFFIEKRLAKENQSILIPGSGVDIDRLLPAPKPDGVPLVVLPGRMLWDKGVQEFVQAAKSVKETGIKCRFALVGAPDMGNPSSISEQQLNEWVSSGVVEWWGWQEDMISVYRKSSLVCLPSYREGLAKSLIEAAACGKPLIASDIPGCREVVKDGVNGFTVQPKEVEQLVNAIIKIISDNHLQKKMGIESRIIAESEFSVEKINEATIIEYNNPIP